LLAFEVRRGDLDRHAALSVDAPPRIRIGCDLCAHVREQERLRERGGQ
jgi:hypothetical protein